MLRNLRTREESRGRKRWRDARISVCFENASMMPIWDRGYTGVWFHRDCAASFEAFAVSRCGWG